MSVPVRVGLAGCRARYTPLWPLALARALSSGPEWCPSRVPTTKIDLMRGLAQKWLLLYFAAVRPSGRLLSNSEKSSYLGGATGIRTPDLLHAIQTRTVVRCGQTSPWTPFTCGDPGRTWPGAAWCLALLAPNLAPRKLVSSANVRWLEQVAD
jgi:hypothetical protein